MKNMKKKENNWTACPICYGCGQRRMKLSNNARRKHEKELAQFEKMGSKGAAPVRPRGHLDSCLTCKGVGLAQSESQVLPDTEHYPHLAIIGAGIGGVALAVACLHRGIPFTLYERDSGFDERSQGYGLTLQQASKAMKGLGVLSLKEGIYSTRHVVHTTDGRVIGEWESRSLAPLDAENPPKRRNIHIARQSLRLALLEQLGGHDVVQWGQQLVDMNDCDADGVHLSFQVEGELKSAHADLVVGADGIRSTVHRLLLGEDALPLSYLGCIVILGICPLESIEAVDRSLLDSATVFQTANGNERIYIMPYAANSVMWQLSFPMPEEEVHAGLKRSRKKRIVDVSGTILFLRS